MPRDGGPAGPSCWCRPTVPPPTNHSQPHLSAAARLYFARPWRGTRRPCHCWTRCSVPGAGWLGGWAGAEALPHRCSWASDKTWGSRHRYPVLTRCRSCRACCAVLAAEGGGGGAEMLEADEACGGGDGLPLHRKKGGTVDHEASHKQAPCAVPSVNASLPPLFG